MHYVLIWWFKEVVTPMLKGYAGLVVYADDFVVTFQYKSDGTRKAYSAMRKNVHGSVSMNNRYDMFDLCSFMWYFK